MNGGAVISPQGENSRWPFCQLGEIFFFFTYSKGKTFISFLLWMPEMVPWQAAHSWD